MWAEQEQRQRITLFCQQQGIKVPSFQVPQELAACLASSLSVLDGEPSSDPVDDLTKRRDALQAELDATITEAAGLEALASIVRQTQETLQALELISRIEQVAAAALKSGQSQASR